MKKTKITALMLATALTLPMPLCSVSALSARSAIIMEADSGTVVYEQDADTRRPMASTTKIMTAICAIESGDLSREITVSAEAVGTEGSSIYLKEGDKLSLESLVWALMLESANDAAEAIAVGVSGSLEAFSQLMNEKAAELGLTNTHFTNPHGLSDDSHYTTARELAKLTAYAMKNDTFRKIVSTDTHKIEYGDSVRNLHNHNKLLHLYDGAVGVKTGFTKASGRCLVSAAEREGMTLVAVTLDAPDDWRDHAELLDMGFQALQRVKLIEAEEAAFISPCIGTKNGDITIRNRDELSVILPRGEHDITRKIIMPRYFYAPISSGDEVGKIEFYDGERLVGSVALYAYEDAPREQYEKGFFEKIFN